MYHYTIATNQLQELHVPYCGDSTYTCTVHVKKTLHTVAFASLWYSCNKTALKQRSKWSTCDKTLLSQPFYSTSWLCTCGPYIQVLIVLSTLVIIAKTPIWAIWALPAFYALVKGWSKYGKGWPEFFSHCENSTVCKVFFDAYRTCVYIL